MEIFHNKNIVFAVIIAMLVEQTFVSIIDYLYFFFKFFNTCIVFLNKIYQALPPPENIRKIKKMQYEICMKKYPMPKGNS